MGHRGLHEKWLRRSNKSVTASAVLMTTTGREGVPSDTSGPKPISLQYIFRKCGDMDALPTVSDQLAYVFHGLSKDLDDRGGPNGEFNKDSTQRKIKAKNVLTWR